MRRVRRVARVSLDLQDLLERQAPLARLQVRLVPLVPQDQREPLLLRVLLAQQDLQDQRETRDQRDRQDSRDPQEIRDPREPHQP